MSIPLLISNSRNTEVDGILGQTIQAYNATSLNSDANLEKIFNPLKDLSVLFSASIRRLKEKSEQKSYDEDRDEKLTGFYYLLVSSSHHPKAKIKTAALLLLTIFDQYGLEIKDESFTRESSLINSLLTDYTSPEALAAIAEVPQCADYLSALQTAQSNFEAKRLSFEEARAQEGTQENASAVKMEVLEIINKQLVPYLNVMALLDDATYGPFERVVAEIISENNEQVKKRRNKGGDNPTDEE